MRSLAVVTDFRLLAAVRSANTAIADAFDAIDLLTMEWLRDASTLTQWRVTTSTFRASVRNVLYSLSNAISHSASLYLDDLLSRCNNEALLHLPLADDRLPLAFLSLRDSPFVQSIYAFKHSLAHFSLRLLPTFRHSSAIISRISP
jgi:hypothetical protein